MNKYTKTPLPDKQEFAKLYKQGFPDNWTAGVSDSKRYFATGNAVTVNVIKAIAEKLLTSHTLSLNGVKE